MGVIIDSCPSNWVLSCTLLSIPLHLGKYGRDRVALAMVGAGSRDHDRTRGNKEAVNIQGVILTMYYGTEIKESRK